MLKLALLITLCSLDVLGQASLALWPIRRYLGNLDTLHGWVALYRVHDASTDVLAATAAKCVLLVVCGTLVRVPSKVGRSRDTTRLTQLYRNMGTMMMLLMYVIYVALMAKSVAIAVLCEGRPWPDAKAASSGVAFVYASVLGCLALSVLEETVFSRMLSDAEAALPEDSDLWADEERSATSVSDTLRRPLLTKRLSVSTKATGESSVSRGYTSGGGASSTRFGPGTGPESGVTNRAPRKRIEHATVGRLLSLSLPDSPLLAVGFATGAVASLGNAYVPKLTGDIIDYASIHQDPVRFHTTVIRLLIIAVGMAIFTGLRGSTFTLAMTCLNIRIRKALFDSFMRQDIGFYDTTKTGDITSRLAADTTTVSDQICLNMNVLTRSMAQAAIVLAFMFLQSWRLTVVTFIMVPVIIAITKTYGAFMRTVSKKVQSALADANSVAEETLSSMTTVRAHAAEDSCQQDFADELRKYYGLQMQEAAAYAVYISTATLLPVVVGALVLYYGGTLVLKGDMSPGGLIAFMLYHQSLSGAFQSIGDVFSSITAAVGSADKVIELIDRKPDIAPTGSLRKENDFEGRLELVDVRFSYPARPNVPVLTGLSLSVEPGEVVALVGPSGSGKSSIVKLLQRFYTPEAGQVLISGHPVGDYDQTWLKRKMALVSQEPTLYARSISRNIVYGLEEDSPPDQDSIEEAARQANAHDFITALPEGYETNCGEKGVTLSGGQKQRIAIARALVRRPPILLLDEATSALDADSEAVVQEALDRMLKGHTVLVIAHRLATVRDADRIIVVDKGTVAEVGDHETLVTKGGLYASLVARQMRGMRSFPSIASLIHKSGSCETLS